MTDIERRKVRSVRNLDHSLLSAISIVILCVAFELLQEQSAKDNLVTLGPTSIELTDPQLTFPITEVHGEGRDRDIQVVGTGAELQLK